MIITSTTQALELLDNNREESTYREAAVRYLTDNSSPAVILRLRRQVIELQSHIRRLEAELTAQYASQHMRLARYREVYYEATWIELEFQE